MHPITRKARARRKIFLSSCYAIGFVVFLSVVILASFLAPHFFIKTLGEAEIHEVASRIANDNSDWATKVNGTMKWVDQIINTTTYQRPHFSPFPGSDLYIMPNYPYIYDRVLDPSWVMFFKRGACEEHAILFVEIARHTGIRARLVYNPGEDHAWAEVFVDNSWIPVDPTRNKFVNPENYENERGIQMSYVYASEGGEVTDVTSRYTNTGRLVVRVERDGELVKDADVIIKSRFLVDSEAEGYGAPELAISSKTDENGTCIFELGGNNYQIIAEDGSYRAVEENISLTEGYNVYFTLSLSPMGTSTWRDLLLLIAVVASAILVIVVFRQLVGDVRLGVDIPTAAGAFMIMAGLTCAFAFAVGLQGLLGLPDPNSIMSSWMFLGSIGGLFGLIGGVLTFQRIRLQWVKTLMMATVGFGFVFWFVYGGFGFVVGLPIVLLSVISLILIALSAPCTRAPTKFREPDMKEVAKLWV